MKKTLTVFLDIDGVLRRKSAPKYKLEGDLVANLEAWVEAQAKDVELVISSTWKDAFTLDQIRAQFPLTLRFKIVGKTPSVSGIQSEHMRYHEVMAYNRKYGIDEWIAFDDQPDLYPAGMRNVISVDGEKGFQL